jgi:hypothetical protein
MIFNVVVSLITGLYTWLSSRDKVSREAIKQVSDSVADVDERVTRIDETLRHLPNKDVEHRVTRVEEAIRFVPHKKELDVLHARITEGNAVQKRMEGEVAQMNQTLHLIHQYLMTNRGGNQ